jgi:WD40 repeat protein/tetratricopeptide (TPR) repeat protein
VHAKLRALLEPLPFDADLAQHLRRFTGRQWVMDRIDAWLRDAAASRVFWITGAPGVGKTAIAAWLCQHRPEVAAFHLCRHGHVQKSDPRRCVLSIAYQLSTQLAEYQDRLNGLDLARLIPESDARTLFDRLLVQPLSANFPRPKGIVVVLIDALDEATSMGRNELAMFLATEFRRTPDWLRLVITSRPDPEVTHPLQAYTPHVLNASSPDNEDDIRAFLRRELQPFTADGGAVSASVIEAILTRSEGIFLYVEWVRQEVAAGRLSLSEPDKFPKGLGEVYAQYVARQFPDTAAYKREIAPALDAIAAAREPLELSMLAAMLGWGERRRHEFQQSLGSVFTSSGGRILPFHKSVLDWLTSAEKAGPYFVSVEEGHQALATLCWGEYRRGLQSISSYALAHLPAHLIAARRWDDLERLLCDLFYLEANVAAGRAFDLVDVFATAVSVLPEERPQRHILVQLANALRPDIHFIARHARDYPQGLFQCLWNNAWWYDCPEAAQHYVDGRSPHFHQTVCGESATGEGGSSSLVAGLRASASIIAKFRAFLSRTTAKWRPIRCASSISHGKTQETRCGGPLPSPNDRSASAPTVHQLLERWREAKERAQPGLTWLRALRPPPVNSGQLAVLRGHESEVKSVAISAGGEWIVSASTDRTVRVWDAHTGEQLEVLRGHERGVISVAISPDGERIVSGSYDDTLRVWDARTGAELAIWYDSVKDVVFSPCGDWIAVGGSLDIVRIWDARDLAERAILRGHERPVNSVAISPDGERIVSGSDDETLRVWDARNGAELAVLRGHEGSVNSVGFSPDGKRIVSSGSDDWTVRVWDTHSGAERAILPVYDGTVRSVAFSYDGERIVGGVGDRVRVWDAHSGTELAVLRGHESWVNSVAFSPDGQRIVSGSFDHTVRVWDAHTSGEAPVVRGHEESVRDLAYSPDGERIVSASDDETVRVWDAHSGAELTILRGHENAVYSVAFSPDGKRIVSGGSILDKTVRVWDVHSGAELAVLHGHERAVTSAAFSPDGKWIISGSDDKTVRVWDAGSGSELAVLRGHESGVDGVAISPDGKRTVSWDSNGNVRVWGTATGAELLALQGCFQDVAFSPDGQRIVSWSVGGTLVWDAEARPCLEVIQGITDLTATAGGAKRFPLRAVMHRLETVVEASDTGHPVARFPINFRGQGGKLAVHPLGTAWAGCAGSHVYIIKLEGTAPDAAKISPIGSQERQSEERVLGREHPDMLAGLQNLAEQMLRRALEEFDRVLGPDEPYTLETVHKLADVLARKGDYVGAEAMYRRALEGRERNVMLGPEHPDTLMTLSNLAYVLVNKGDGAAAEPLYRRALEARDRVLGPDDPYTLETVHKLADVLASKADHAGAEEMYRRALEARDRVLGSEHPDTLRTISDLAFFLWSKGDHAGAEPLYRRALESYERVLGPDHPDTLVSMNNLALLLEQTGDYDGAEAEYVKAVERWPTHEWLLGNYAFFLQNVRRDFPRAQDIYLRGLSANPDIAVNHTKYAGLCFVMGATSEAEEQLCEAWRLESGKQYGCTYRALFLRGALAATQQADTALYLGQLKTLFDQGVPPIPAHNTSVHEHLQRTLPSDQSALFDALYAAINEPDGVTRLSALPAWQAIPPRPLDEPWP